MLLIVTWLTVLRGDWIAILKNKKIGDFYKFAFIPFLVTYIICRLSNGAC